MSLPTIMRGAAVEIRLGVETGNLDIRVIDAAVPDDWVSKKYVPMVRPDPANPAKPIVTFVDITPFLTAPSGGGWGIYGTYAMGSL